MSRAEQCAETPSSFCIGMYEYLSLKMIIVFHGIIYFYLQCGEDECMIIVF